MLTDSFESLWPSLQGLLNLDKALGKWFLIVLVVIFIAERASFSSLKRAIKPISNKVLSNRLKELERLGLLAKRIIVEHPLRVEYHLTERGKSLARGFASFISPR